ncbi:MAG TPA: BtpA/SgcQ family protein [Chthonomonadaceae bacterium]|nr:BtpA/SgcQ family protein [Chthonomonadaceae bacterium]
MRTEADVRSDNFGGLDEKFWARRPLIGMVHLPALPGSPADSGRGMQAVIDSAVADARDLESGGATAIMVENFFDAPFAKDRVPPHTIAGMTVAVMSVRRAVGLPIGVNVLRNDARSAIAIAHVCGAQFVRVNVWVGAAVTDQGIIEGAARDAILYRRELGADVAIFADVFVKHAVPLGGGSLQDAARDAVHRGLADALIVTGSSTGAPTRPEDVAAVKAAVPGTPVLVGSGLDVSTAAAMMAHADGAIVGTGLKRGGDVAAPVEPERVRGLRAAMRAAR